MRSPPADPDRSAAVVSWQSVSVRYRGGDSVRTVLREVSGSIAAGEVLAVSGPSGSGKTTLLHVLAGLQPPTSGAVNWPALRCAPDERPGSVTVAFQSPSLVQALDVTENVALPLVLAGGSDAQARSAARDVLASLALSSLGTQLPEELSGGQAQRVALARALVSRPVLLLADEPTGQIDGSTAADLLDALLREVRLRGTSLVLATHDPAVLDRADRRCRLVDGRLTAVDPLAPVLCGEHS